MIPYSIKLIRVKMPKTHLEKQHQNCVIWQYQTLFHSRNHYNNQLLMQEVNIKALQIDSSVSSNTFSMKRVTVTNAPTVIVNFTPVPASNDLQKIDPNNQLLKWHPIFNTDGFYFTPTFLLHQDKLRVANNLEVFLTMHQTKVLQTVEQKEEMFLPRPSKTNSFCCVCKSYYEDYLNHVSLPEHVQNLEKNKFRKDIDKLCKSFNKKESKKVKITKCKQIKKQTVKFYPVITNKQLGYGEGSTWIQIEGNSSINI